MSLLALFLLPACVTVETVDTGRGVTEVTDEVTATGIEFSVAHMPGANRVSVHVVWPNRWVHENNKPVAASLGVDLMSSGGTADRSAKKIKQQIAGLGSSASLVTTPDHVYGTFTAPVETIAETLDIVRDVLIEPVLSEAGFDTLKEAMIKRVEARQQNESARLLSISRQLLMGTSSLTDYWNNTPFERVVEPVSLGDIKQWRKNTFVQKGVTVAVAGDIGVPGAAAWVDQLLADLPKDPVIEDTPQFKLKTGTTLLIHDKAATNTHIAVIGLLPPSSDGSEIMDIVAVGALGKGKESRLGKAQINESSASLNASIANFSRDVRVFGINAQVTDDTAVETYALIQKTYEDFKLADLNDQDVLRAAVPFANSLKSNATRVDLIAYGLGQLLLDELPKERLLTVMQDSLSIRPAEINSRITESYPNWESLVKVVLTSDDELIEADCVVTGVDQLAECEI